MQLYSPAELTELQHELPSLVETMEWVNQFLAKPHPDLGRTGPVCPFLPRALQQNTIRLAVIRSKDMDASQIEDLVMRYRDSFLEMEPQQGNLAFYKSLMLVFPDVSDEEAFTVVDGIQQRLKPFFVKEGLMIGEFHKGNQSPGLHNPDFRPLRSPIPMLAIRFMAESDLPFLDRITDQPEVRIQYLEAYLKRLGAVAKDEKKVSHAQQALSQAKAQVQNEQAQAEPISQPSKCPFAKLIRFFKGLRRFTFANFFSTLSQQSGS